MVDARRFGGFVAALGWLVFPAVPVVLEGSYNGILEFSQGDRQPPDPRDWAWWTWVVELGPLLGFGFLAGATLDLPDPPTDRRGPVAWLSKRSVWVALGPWSGPAWVAALSLWFQGLPPLPRAVADRLGGAERWLSEVGAGPVLGTGFFALLVALIGYAWLWPAWSVVRRARAAGPGRAWRAVRRGIGVALAFVASLFGTFWAVTEAWRGFFFDPRVVPVVLAGLSLVALEGCASPVTVGDVRRRELFRALLLAWVFGLGLLWLWWSRPRTKPPAAGGR